MVTFGRSISRVLPRTGISDDEYTLVDEYGESASIASHPPVELKYDPSVVGYVEYGLILLLSDDNDVGSVVTGLDVVDEVEVLLP